MRSLPYRRPDRHEHQQNGASAFRQRLIPSQIVDMVRTARTYACGVRSSSAALARRGPPATPCCENQVLSSEGGSEVRAPSASLKRACADSERRAAGRCLQALRSSWISPGISTPLGTRERAASRLITGPPGDAPPSTGIARGLVMRIRSRLSVPEKVA